MWDDNKTKGQIQITMSIRGSHAGVRIIKSTRSIGKTDARNPELTGAIRTSPKSPTSFPLQCSHPPHTRASHASTDIANAGCSGAGQ